MTALQILRAPQPGHLTLSQGRDDFASYLVVERNCPNTTVRAYRTDLEQLADFLKDKPAVDVTTSDLRAWLECLHENYAPSSIGRKLACARSYFRFGKREGWAKDNPAKELDLPRRDRVLPKVLSERAVNRLLEKVTSTRDRALLEVMYSGGLRVAEVVGLDLEDINLDDAHLRVFGKGGRERICPIGQAAVTALQDYLADRGTEPGALFLNYRGGRLSDRSVRKLMKKLGDATPHDLRHSSATHLIDTGPRCQRPRRMVNWKYASCCSKLVLIPTSQRTREIPAIPGAGRHSTGPYRARSLRSLTCCGNTVPLKAVGAKPLMPRKQSDGTPFSEDSGCHVRVSMISDLSWLQSPESLWRRPCLRCRLGCRSTTFGAVERVNLFETPAC